LAEIDSQEGNEAATFELTYSTTASISSLFPAPETLILCIIQVLQLPHLQPGMERLECRREGLFQTRLAILSDGCWRTGPKRLFSGGSDILFRWTGA
jgi:hypothetical protein